MASEIEREFDPSLEQRGVDVIRALSLDAPHKAKSGHQGTAMALAPLAHVLFTRILKYHAEEPTWADRDRFILSAGHASILHYSLLYLTGFGLSLEDLKNFRQLDSNTPGHPEAGHTAGIEVTTGPLGQGFANGVGMALTERFLRNKYGSGLCDHHTFVIASDGDLAEGVSHEAASLAGHQKLDRLVVVYDDNDISIDGPTNLALSDNALDRFDSYGWNVVPLVDAANDLPKLTDTLASARSSEGKGPTLIALKTQVGYPSPKWTGNHKAHGNPFDAEEIAATKEVMGLDADADFQVPDDVLNMYRSAGVASKTAFEQWNSRLMSSQQKSNWEASQNGDLPSDFVSRVEKLRDSIEPGSKTATRKASQAFLTELTPELPNIIGGSADLTGNTGTSISNVASSAEQPGGNQIYFGIREHGMGSALVGAARHGGVIPIGGTFLVFSDYMRPSVRLAAMSNSKCVFVWTHDSIGVGEDGPTHQPIEQVMSLRSIPNLRVIRPADATETYGAWLLALESDGPTAMILTRQDVPNLDTTSLDGVRSGGYRIRSVSNASINLISSGSEVHLCVEAAEKLEDEGISANVISMPCWSEFDSLDRNAQSAVLDRTLPTLSIEAGVTLGWHKYADVAIGVDSFGASAPADKVFRKFGITSENVVVQARSLVANSHTD